MIIRGARQVGKTTLARQLGKTYPHFIALNLEKKEYQRIFEKTDRTTDILNAIFLQTNTPRTDKETLLFFDEIQECPPAIRQLRYFYEETPGIHVVAAGSLLEFAMGEVSSFPVGRVEQWVLHPLDFEEYLLACGQETLARELDSVPVKSYAHDALLRHFHEYAIVGGMPEAVRRFVAEGSMANLPDVFGNLWQGWLDDVEKYARNAKSRNVIRYLMKAAATEKDRISFAGFSTNQFSAREVREAFQALDMARIIQLIFPTTAQRPPLLEELNRQPRLQFLDTGLLNYLLGLQGELVGVNDLHDFHVGKIIQHLVVQQVQAQSRSPLFKPAFWVREKANTTAEVDLVLQHGKYVVPVEIKSGKQGRLRSLHQFMDTAGHPYAIRLLANELSMEKPATPAGTPFLLLNLPYYLAPKLQQYITWLIENEGR